MCRSCRSPAPYGRWRTPAAGRLLDRRAGGSGSRWGGPGRPVPDPRFRNDDLSPHLVVLLHEAQLDDWDHSRAGPGEQRQAVPGRGAIASRGRRAHRRLIGHLQDRDPQPGPDHGPLPGRAHQRGPGAAPGRRRPGARHCARHGREGPQAADGRPGPGGHGHDPAVGGQAPRGGHPYRHEPVILPGRRPSPLANPQVSHLCPVLKPHRDVQGVQRGTGGGVCRSGERVQR